MSQVPSRPAPGAPKAQGDLVPSHHAHMLPGAQDPVAPGPTGACECHCRLAKSTADGKQPLASPSLCLPCPLFPAAPRAAGSGFLTVFSSAPCLSPQLFVPPPVWGGRPQRRVSPQGMAASFPRLEGRTALLPAVPMPVSMVVARAACCCLLLPAAAAARRGSTRPSAPLRLPREALGCASLHFPCSALPPASGSGQRRGPLAQAPWEAGSSHPVPATELPSRRRSAPCSAPFSRRDNCPTAPFLPAVFRACLTSDLSCLPSPVTQSWEIRVVLLVSPCSREPARARASRAIRIITRCSAFLGLPSIFLLFPSINMDAQLLLKRINKNKKGQAVSPTHFPPSTGSQRCLCPGFGWVGGGEGGSGFFSWSTSLGCLRKQNNANKCTRKDTVCNGKSGSTLKTPLLQPRPKVWKEASRQPLTPSVKASPACLIPMVPHSL